MNKEQLYNYINLCKKKDLSLILNISRDVQSSIPTSQIATKYSINENEIEGVKMIMSHSTDQKMLIDIFKKYMKAKGFQYGGHRTMDEIAKEIQITKTTIDKCIIKIHSLKKELKNMEKYNNVSGYLNEILQLENMFHTSSSTQDDINNMDAQAVLLAENNQHGSGVKVCACCDCSKDGYIFTEDGDIQKCSKQS
jgi:hypothetical protein